MKLIKRNFWILFEILYIFFFLFFCCFFRCNKQANSLRSSAWPRTSLFLVLLRSMNCRLMHPSSSQDTGPGKCSRVSSLLFRVAMQPVDVASRHELASKISLAKIDDGWRYPRWIRWFSQRMSKFYFIFVLFSLPFDFFLCQMIDNNGIVKLVSIPATSGSEERNEKEKKSFDWWFIIEQIVQTATSETKAWYFLLKKEIYFSSSKKKHFYIHRNQY